MTTPEVGAVTSADLGTRLRPRDDDPIYRRIVEAANEGVWVADAHGRTTFANDKVAEILGYCPTEMATLSMFDILDEPGKVLGAERLERRRLGISELAECEVIRKDGTRVSVQFAASPLRGDDGEYAGSIAMVSDVSHRNRVEQALRLREQQLAEAQQVAHLGSWVWDIASDAVTWSDEMYRLLGLQPQEIPASSASFVSHVHPDDRDMLQAHVSTALEGGAFGFDHRITRPDGEIVWLRARGHLVRDDAGAPLRIQGTGQDITESKQAEAALGDAASRYHLLQVMAVAANEAGSISEALRVAVEEICAHTPWAAGHAYLAAPNSGDGLVAQPIWHLADPEELAPLRAARIDAATSVAAGVLADGQPRFTLDLAGDLGSALAGMALELGMPAAFAFPVLVEGEVSAVLEFFSATQVAADDALLETIAQVGTQLARVVERQRASDELAAARDAAMDASRLKSEFLATMSHEIRTPMNGVIGLTELLLGTDLDERQRQYADGVEGAGKSLLSIINDILDFSKIEAGRLEIESVDFDLLATIEQTADLVAEAAQGKRLELLTHCHANLPIRLRGDPARIRQVLINLASNAVKFTERGEVVIRARRVESLGAALDDDVMAHFEVTDTGVGIMPRDLERLFEPFIQADASTTRNFGGTGLGLAISRKLVAAMGGEIGVDSVPGHGSTFWFTLPLQRQSGPPEPVVRPEQQLLKGLRVLVVDDSGTNQLILREQLGSWGMHAEAAIDGWAALDQLRAAVATDEPYHLVVLDLSMPGMDGLQLAHQISADARLAAARLVLLTSGADPGAEMTSSAGISAQLRKPVRQSTLYNRLVEVLSPVPSMRSAVHIPGPVTTTVRGQVLVAEDNPVNQLVARGMLAHLGYGSDVANNGLEALDAMVTTDYSAVLMDCHMPEMDGYAATAEIRRREGDTRHTPIIALTASAVAGDRQRCLDAGMDDYLAKPVKAEDLGAALARWFSTISTSGEHG